MGKRIFAASIILGWLSATSAQSQADRAAFTARRQQVAAKLDSGILLLHAAGGMKTWESNGFHQDPSFEYFTGLPNLQNGILVIDGGSGRTWLFIQGRPNRPQNPAFTGAAAVFIDTGAVSERALELDHVVAWDRFASVIDSLNAGRQSPVLYLDGGGQTGRMLGRESNPSGLAPVSNPYRTWRFAITQRWPKVEIRDAWPAIDEVRSVKSPEELDKMRKAAAATVAAIHAAARAIRPGVTQRAVEGVAVAAALANSSDGPSLWPWIRSGGNSLNAPLFDAFFDVHNLDRTMKPGDIVRVDLGFDYDEYKGDAGRTFPVSGHFTPAQREALDLLTGAYKAGVAAMRVGASQADVIAAFKQYVLSHQASLTVPAVRDIAASLATVTGLPIHGLGLDMAEGVPAKFVENNVICFEPGVVVDGQQLFVEDTILITRDGPQILNPPMPYSAVELERWMVEGRR